MIEARQYTITYIMDTLAVLYYNIYVRPFTHPASTASEDDNCVGERTGTTSQRTNPL